MRDTITRGQTAELGILTQRPGSRSQSHQPTGNTGLEGCGAGSPGVTVGVGSNPDPTGHVDITWTEMQSSQEDESLSWLPPEQSTGLTHRLRSSPQLSCVERPHACAWAQHQEKEPRWVAQTSPHQTSGSASVPHHGRGHHPGQATLLAPGPPPLKRALLGTPRQPLEPCHSSTPGSRDTQMQEQALADCDP